MLNWRTSKAVIAQIFPPGEIVKLNRSLVLLLLLAIVTPTTYLVVQFLLSNRPTVNSVAIEDSPVTSPNLPTET